MGNLRGDKGRLVFARTFAGAAARYWVSVYPRVRREFRHWQARAQEIPEPVLRGLALSTQREERGNLEGAAAYAVLAPRSQRARVVRVLIAFQAIYDYVDTLAEQPSADPAANGRLLHSALASALDPGSGQSDYYLHGVHKDDGGYLRDLVDACKRAFGALPAHASLGGPVQRAVQRMVAYQDLSHEQRSHQEDAWRAFSQWADAQLPEGSGLRWWETAAGAASSLLVLALIAAAADPALSPEHTDAIERAYFPWIGALHLLLDSLIDREDDVSAGRYSLVDHYVSPEETAVRLQAISTEALRASKELPHPDQHGLIVAAMASYYLAQPAASSPASRPARTAILTALGERAVPATLLFRMRNGRPGHRRGSL